MGREVSGASLTTSRVVWGSRMCYARLFCTLSQVGWGGEREPHAAVRHLARRASCPKSRGQKAALTTTGSWWPRLCRGWGACLVRSCDEERAARASVGLWELVRGLDRQLGPVDEPWVLEVDESPGERVPSRRLTEQGTPSTLESSLTSSASASPGEIGERTMGAVCSRSALAYWRRSSASRAKSRDSEGGGTAPEGCVGSPGSTDDSREELLLAAGEGVAADWSAPSAGTSAMGLLCCVDQLAGHG